MPLQDLVQHRLVPLTSVAPTLVDCVPHLPGRRLARAVDDALRRRLLTVAELTACAARLDHGGGRRLLPLRAVLVDRQGSYHPGGSERELDVATILVAGGLGPPVPQHRVVVGGRERFIDYAYPDELVGLEFDGFADHGLIRSTFDDDRQRGNDLTVAGWLMLHFTSNSPPAHIVGSTRQALALRSPDRASSSICGRSMWVGDIDRPRTEDVAGLGLSRSREGRTCARPGAALRGGQCRCSGAGPSGAAFPSRPPPTTR